MGVSPNHLKFDHLSFETHGDLGIPVLGNFHRNRCNGNRKGTKELFSTREHHH